MTIFLSILMTLNAVLAVINFLFHNYWAAGFNMFAAILLSTILVIR